ncbi:MAG: type IX secretion system membrane protein PorP/SprF [candidate division KSB1 bacterium]|nr:type IX secretion system membrane protein PorP/SprF [candidate division KSB1 bacterium]
MRNRQPRKDGIRFLVFGLWLLGMMGGLQAQGYQIWNSADRQYPWSSEINPAILPFHSTQISFGLKVYHFGFLPNSAFGIRENRINASFPFYLPYDIAIGGALRYFSAGLYSEVAASVLLGYEIWPALSIGAKIGLERRGFRAGDFVGFDPNDPLLKRGLATVNLNLGVGAYYEMDNWRFGLGVDHANRPNVGRLNQAIYPREISASIAYRYGNITPTLLIRDDGVRWRFGMIITMTKSSVGQLRLGYEHSMPIKVEAQLNLNRNSRLDYVVDLPKEGTRGASAGTQELIYTHILGRRPEIGEPVILFTTNKLEILEETVYRSMTADLRIEELRAFPELIPEYMNTTEPHNENMLVVVAGPLNKFETREGRLDRHRRLAKSIAKYLETIPTLNAYLLAEASTLKDAREIQRAVARLTAEATRVQIVKLVSGKGKSDFRGFQPGRISIERKKPKLSASELGIYLEVPTKTRKTLHWQMRILNARNEPVATFLGSGRLPYRLTWNWRDDRGRLVQPGRYICDLRIMTTSGRERHVVSKPVQVTLIRRHVRIHFKGDPEFKTSQTEEERFSSGEL